MAKKRNLLEMKPIRNYEWLMEEDRVIIRIPKFRSRLGKKLAAKMKEPNYRVKLDDHGSLVWHLCDGKTKVAKIEEEMRTKFVEEEKIRERLVQFLGSLEKNGLIRYEEES